MEFVKIILTLAIGGLGGIILGKKKVPGGFLVGSLLFVTIWTLVSGMGYIPKSLKLLTQIVSGMFIGSKISRKDLPVLVKMIVPALIASGSMILLCLALGYLLGFMPGMSSLTAMLCCSPGGVVDITMLSMDVGADTSVVSVIQAFRLALVVGVFPSLMRKIIASQKGQQALSRYRLTCDEERTEVEKNTVTRKQLSKPVRIALTFLSASVIGYLGSKTGIPAGALLFSMIGSAAFNIITGQFCMPKQVKQATQVLAGALTGVTMTL